MYAEIIYETGAKSVGYYKDEAQLLEGVREQHRRAKSGEPSYSGEADGPVPPAERVVRIEIYNKHPHDLNEEQTVSSEVAKSEVAALIKELDENGSLSVTELAARVRELSSPLVLNGKQHESMYKMPADKVLTSGWDN